MITKNTHVILTTATATAAAAAGAAGAAVAGDSLQTQSIGRKAGVIAAWHTTNTNAGFVQLSGPNAHDRTRGYRVGVPAAATEVVLPLGDTIEVDENEVIDILIGANAVAGDVEQLSYLTRYNEGRGQTWCDWSHVLDKREKTTTIEQAIVSAAGPGYSGTALINATTNLLIPNREYAVVGFSSRTRVHLAGIVGPDTGNARVGCPCFLRREFTSQFFKLLSQVHREPLIPIIKANSAAQTSFFVHTDENAGTFTITMHLVLLK